MRRTAILNWLIIIGTAASAVISAGQLQQPVVNSEPAVRMISLIRARTAQKKHHLATTTTTAIPVTSRTTAILANEDTVKRAVNVSATDKIWPCEKHLAKLIARYIQHGYAKLMRKLSEGPPQQLAIAVLSLSTILIACVICAAKRCKNRRAGYALPPPPNEMLAAP